MKNFTCHVSAKPIAFPTSAEHDCINYRKPERAVPRRPPTCRVTGRECDAREVIAATAATAK